MHKSNPAHVYRIMASVLDLIIGNTPLVEVTRIDRGPCRLFLKLESANPSGSLKDRPARAMIEGRRRPMGVPSRAAPLSRRPRANTGRASRWSVAVRRLLHAPGGAGQDGARAAQRRRWAGSRHHALRRGAPS